MTNSITSFASPVVATAARKGTRLFDGWATERSWAGVERGDIIEPEPVSNDTAYQEVFLVWAEDEIVAERPGIAIFRLKAR
jgi:hypothetical protein